MKKIFALFISFLIICSYSANIFAVGAPDATAAIHAQTLWQKANATIQNNEFVQTVTFLKKNYDQTKKYYEYVQELNKYEGGIGAYFRDSIINAFTNTRDTAVYDLQSAWDNPDTKKSTYVEEIEKYVERKKENVDKKIDEKIDSLFKQQKAKKEAQEIQMQAIDRYITLASKTSLTTAEKNEMDKLQGTILVNAVASIQRELEIINAREAQKELERQEALKRDASDFEEFKKFLEETKNQEQGNRQQNKKLWNELNNKGISYGK